MNKKIKTGLPFIGITLFLFWCTSHSETDDFPVKNDRPGRITIDGEVNVIIKGTIGNGDDQEQNKRYRVEVSPVSKPLVFTDNNREFNTHLSLNAYSEIDCYTGVESTTSAVKPIMADLESATNTVEPFVIHVYDGDICVASYEYKNMHYKNVNGKRPEVDVGTLDLNEKK